MVIPCSSRFARERGALMTELVVAISILVVAVMPVGYSIAKEKLLARTYYQRAIAMEIVDGEMEVLLAGGWRTLAQGTHEYPVRANAMSNLPPGRFLVTIQANKVRLEWRPDQKHSGGVVVREAVVR